MKLLIGSNMPYRGLQQVPHHIYRTLSDKFSFTVTWLDNPNFLPLQYENDIKLGASDTMKSLKNVNISDSKIANYKLLSLPFYLKNRYSWHISEKMVEWQVKRYTVKSDSFIVYSPIFHSVAESFQKEMQVVYHVLDDFSGWTGVNDLAVQKELELISLSDKVIVSSEVLLHKMTRYTSRVYYIPNFVPHYMFQDYGETCRRSPRIGFVGFFGDWLNYDLLLKLSRSRPDWLFYFAGDGPALKEFRRKAPENCRFLGRVDHIKVPYFISRIDVGIVPFRKGRLTDAAFPTKMLEYFAQRKPVVSTPLTEIKNIAGDLVYYASSVDQWVDSLKAALKDDRASLYQQLAKKYSLDKSIRSFLNVLKR